MSSQLHNTVDNERPWPVVLLTALGAWLAAVPILASLVMLVGEAVFSGIGSYIIGILALAASVALLRAKSLPLFVEQLAVPILLMGGIALGIALFRDLPDRAGAALMAALCVGVAFAIPRAWLATLLGAAACALLVVAFEPHWDRLLPQSSLFSLLGAMVLWLFMLRFPQDLFATLVPVSNGWVLATLLGLAFWSGMTFLAGASIEPFNGNGDAHGRYGYGTLAPLASLVLAVAAAAWLAHRWPSLRRSWSAGAALVVIGLAWLMPSLGAVLLILAVCATHGRWRLAATAGLAVAWIIGAFYYQLAFSLATKAAIMVGAGAGLGTLAWLALRGGAIDAAGPQPTNDTPRARLAIAACAALVLAVANFGIWQKQTLIAEGRPVFVELAPVDPRSLMQGDYMRLGFRFPSGSLGNALAQGGRRPYAIGKIDARGVATLERIDIAPKVAPDEIAIEMTPTRNGWTLVTDAWYFREGDAARWQRAKYGEFRVTPDGRALLVGMRGAALEPLLTP